MRLGAVLAISAAMLASCKREQRQLRDEPAQRAVFSAATESHIVPGGKVAKVIIKSPAEGNAYAISQGQKLFSFYNCSGCHGEHGGGGIGPPLMEKQLHFGSEPDNIYDTISKGRPNGMPSWGARIPESQIWQLVAYVKSLSGEEPKNASNARADTMETKTRAQLK